MLSLTCYDSQAIVIDTADGPIIILSRINKHNRRSTISIQAPLQCGVSRVDLDSLAISFKPPEANVCPQTTNPSKTPSINCTGRKLTSKLQTGSPRPGPPIQRRGGGPTSGPSA